jgi:hypothetical protein
VVVRVVAPQVTLVKAGMAAQTAALLIQIILDELLLLRQVSAGALAALGIILLQILFQTIVLLINTVLALAQEGQALAYMEQDHPADIGNLLLKNILCQGRLWHMVPTKVKRDNLVVVVDLYWLIEQLMEMDTESEVYSAQVLIR